MGIINRLREQQIRAAGTSTSLHPGDPELVKLLGGGALTASGQSVTADTAMRSSAVYAAVRRISDGVAMVPLQLFRRTQPEGREKADDHSLYPVLHDQPNAWQTSMEFREMLQAHLLLRGNAYAIKQLTNSGYVEQLIPLHPDRMQPYWIDKRRGTFAYQYTWEDGRPQIFLQDEIMHLRGLSQNGLMGLNPIEYHRETVGLALAAQEYGARFYANDGATSFWLEHPNHFKEKEKREAFRKALREQTTGANRHLAPVLEDGIKIHELGINQRDAQYIEGRKFSVNDIARIFLISPHMIGDLERATFSNITQLSLEHVIYTLMSWYVRWEQTICRDLLLTRKEKTELFVKFIADALLRGDLKSRFDAYHLAIIDGHMNRNEVRLLEDRNPVEGLDEFLQPANMDDASDASDASDAGDNGGGTEPRPDREQQLTEAAAKRIVNKEYKAIRKQFERTTDAAGRSAWLADFYREHQTFVAEVLGVGPRDAEDYCGRSTDRWQEYIARYDGVNGRFEQVQYNQLLITAALANN